MAKIHTLTYNGTKSSDLGVFVSGSGSFDAAEFDVDKYEIPGRNGDLILSNNRYKNIEITYPAFLPKAFMDKVQNVRNWLRSSKVYARLEDTYDMDHYRLGIPTGVQSFSPENRNDGANFEMTFDCKPQRFLKVGETPETVEADVQTETGEIVTFETIAESPMTSAEVSLSPIQSLNGYDSPWPAGGGKNKLPTSMSGTVLDYSVIYSTNEDGSISANGTATGNSQVIYGECPITAGIKYRLTCGLTSGNPTLYWVRYVVRDANNVAINVPGIGSVFIEISATTDNMEFEAPSNAAKISAYLNVSNGTTVNNIIFKPMVRLASVTDASFSPYSNICPISGHTGAELNVAAEYDAEDKTTYSVTFSDQGTVYGGTYDFVSGKLEVQWANIASYNGETITEPWLSSMDVYSAGATPTTGAQVVYKLATPIEYTLTHQQLTTLLGENNVWGSGPITLTYAEPYNIDNPTLFDARPLFTVTNPAEGDVIMVNGQAITFVDGYTGTVYIDCETMNAFSGAANLNSIIQATDFPVLVPGTNIVTWTGAGECTMTPRWWEL